MADPSPALVALTRRLAEGTAALPDKPEETAEGAARALWLAAAGRPLSIEAALEAALPPLDATGEARLEALVARRLEGVPLAHLTERQRFMGIDLIAGPAALVPRKETELLGRVALSKLDKIDTPVIVDVCTGSGNLALALAIARPDARVFAADLSGEAVALARENAALLDTSERVSFFDGDLFAPLPLDALAGKADLVVCNPPYISSAKVDSLPTEIAAHEPRLAFDGGSFGLTIVGRLLKEALAVLKPGAWLCFEIGKGQGAHWQKTLGRMAAYDAVETASDEAGEVRALAARKAR